MDDNNNEWLELIDFNLNDLNAQNFMGLWQTKCQKLKYQLPNDEELLKRWWRLQLIAFIQRTLQKNGYSKHPMHEFGTEEYLFQRYPWMADQWVTHKIRLNAKIPLISTLRKRWWAGKRRNFALRHLRVRERYAKRKLRLDKFVYRMIWCLHPKCWYLRLFGITGFIVILSLIHLIIPLN